MGWPHNAQLLPRVPYERRAIARAVREHAAAATSFHVQFKREQIGLSSVLARHAPVLWTEHGRFTTGREGYWLAKGYRRSAQHAAAIVCVSPVVADDVREIVGPDPEILVIPNAVDTNRLKPPSQLERAEARLALGVTLDETVVAWVGRMEDGKLPALGVSAGRAFGGVTLMAGDGPALEAVTKSLTDGRVRTLGHLEDPTQLYRAADLFLFTSAGRGEGFPTTMLEAAAHGLPIVANTGSGCAEIVAAAGGLVADDTPAALSQALSVASTERGDRSRAARAWAHKHDRVGWLDRHEEVLRSLT